MNIIGSFHTRKTLPTLLYESSAALFGRDGLAAVAMVLILAFLLLV